MPKHMTDEEVASELYRGTPRAVSALIRQCAGSEKLQTQLDAADGVPAIASFYKIHLYADLELPSFIAKLRELSDTLRSSEYLLEAHLWKLRYMLPRIAVSDKDDQEFRKLIATTVGQLEGGTKALRGATEAREYQRLEKRKMLERLKLRVQGSDKSLS